MTRARNPLLAVLGVKPRGLTFSGHCHIVLDGVRVAEGSFEALQHLREDPADTAKRRERNCGYSAKARARRKSEREAEGWTPATPKHDPQRREQWAAWQRDYRARKKAKAASCA